MDYMKRFDDLRIKMRQKAEETDRKYNIRSRLDDVTRTAEDAVRKGADVAMLSVALRELRNLA